MSSINKLTDWHKRQLGTKENPAGSNKTRYGALYGVNGVAWCCQYIWAGFKECGMSELFYGGKKTASCTALMRWAKSAGQWVTEGYREGDILLYDFNSSRNSSEHVGYCLDAGDGYVTAIEGNTSATAAGSQTNGGEVAKKRRPYSNVLGAFRPDYGENEMTQNEFNEMMEKYLAQMDEKDPSEWSAEARAWAEKNGVIKGDEKGRGKYRAFASREEVVQILFNMQK